MPIVWEVVGKGVTGYSPPKPSRHGKIWVGSEVNEADGGNNPRTCRLAFLANAEPRPCPVEGFSGRVST